MFNTSMQKKIIKYYRWSNYGTVREVIAPRFDGDAKIIQQLTGKKTIDSMTRELIQDLTGGMVTFQEVVKPN